MVCTATHACCVQRFSLVLFTEAQRGLAMAVVSLLSANVATLCIESLLYGVFLVLSVASMYMLVQRSRASTNVPWHAKSTLFITPMSVAAVLLFMTNTAHWIIGVYRAFRAFIYFEGGQQPFAYFNDMRQPTEVSQTALLMVSLIIGDSVLVYRLWIIWAFNNRSIVIFPACTLLGLTTCAIGVIYQLARPNAKNDIFDSATGRWITSNCVFTLCTNVYSTAFIGWRILRTNREAQRIGGSNLMGILGILVESAALYTAWTIFFFVTYHVQSNLQYTCSDTYCAIAGITFMLINVRVGMGSATRTTQPGSAIAVEAGREGGEQAFRMEHLSVNITRVVQRDDGNELPMKFASRSSVELDFELP